MQNNNNNTIDSKPERSADYTTYEYSGISWLKTIIVLAILAAITAALITYMKLNKPEAKKGKPPKASLSVEAQTPSLQSYPIKIAANGTVNAITRGILTSEVSGQIIKLSPNFNNGGTFKKGEILARVDARNFNVGVTSASGNISSAEAQLSQAKASQISADSTISQAESEILNAQSNYDRESALAEQAKRDWQRLGYEGEPNDLVLRKQQLSASQAQLSAAIARKQSAEAQKQVALSQEQSALAQIDSAKASLSRAKLDSSRTRIRAPYSGTVISRAVELGQFINPGSALGEIFSNKGLEVLLPLNQNQFSQLDIDNKPKVELTSQLAGKTHTWQAEITRADSLFDTTTRQLNVTALLLNPLSDLGAELKVGQYVNANIKGRIVENAIVIPNKAIREGSYIFTLDDGTLRKKNIQVVWQDSDNAIIEGLNADAMVVTTAIGGAANGTAAKLIGSKLNKSDKQFNPNSSN